MEAPDTEKIHKEAALDATGEYLPGIEDGYAEEIASQMEFRRLVEASVNLIDGLRAEKL